MRKLGYVVASLATIIAMSAHADCAKTAAVDEEIVADDAIINDDTVDYSGAYFGVGIGGQFLKGKNLSDADADGLRGAGITLKQHNANRFVGTLVAGIGKTFNKVYVGMEGMLDMSGSKTVLEYANDADSMKVSVKGFVPSIGWRLGYVHAPFNGMIYTKFGLSWLKASIVGTNDGIDHFGQERGSKWKCCPTLALGIEKKFCKVVARLEAEYNFGAKFAKNHDDIKPKKICKGFGIRALLKYNIHF